MAACKDPRRGFTLVELLVVITIIGILIALLLPAVQAAREAARRAQCSNNLKQVALALHNYHAALRCFPPAINVQGSESGIDGAVLRENWVISILPHLEQQALYDKFNRNLPISDAANRDPRGVSISALLCPSDMRGNQTTRCSQSGGNWARGNYGANLGLGGPSDTTAWNDRLQRGVMGRNAAVPIDEIRDGTTNTLLVLEIRAGLHAVDRRGTWAMALCAASCLCRHGSNYVTRPNKCSFGDDDLADCDQIISAVGNNTMQLECMGCYQTGFYQSVTRSTHPGGVFAALADGSVRFISDHVETGYQTVGFDPDPAKFLTWQRIIVSSDRYPIDASKW